MMADNYYVSFDQISNWFLQPHKEKEEYEHLLMYIVIATACIFMSIVVKYGLKLACLNLKKEQNVDVQEILNQICKGAKVSHKVTKFCNNIREKIKNKKMNEQKLLSDSIKNVLEELELEDQAEINAFLNVRAALRLKIFQMRGPINIEDNNVNSFDCDKVCQLLEDHVKPSSRQQRLAWYKYIEENEINGSTFLENTKDITKVLELNEDQEDNLKKLMEKIGNDLNQKSNNLVKELQAKANHDESSKSQ